MRTVLHILTEPEDDLAHALIETQRMMAEVRVEVISLHGDPDYESLVDRIFTADSVEVW
jgi:hypothetical protein